MEFSISNLSAPFEHYFLLERAITCALSRINCENPSPCLILGCRLSIECDVTDEEHIQPSVLIYYCLARSPTTVNVISTLIFIDDEYNQVGLLVILSKVIEYLFPG